MQILKSEVEKAIHCLKYDKSSGIDNVSSELIKDGGLAITKIFTKLSQQIWLTRILYTKSWTISLIIPITEKIDIQKCSNYYTISLISYRSKHLLSHF